VKFFIGFGFLRPERRAAEGQQENKDDESFHDRMMGAAGVV
jgi:hypothetical protein